MKDEKAFWDRFLKPLLHRPMEHRVAWKVGTSTRAGIPDVWFCWEPAKGAWLELKYVPSWPVRPGTKVHVELSPEQRSHLSEAKAAGYPAFCLLGVENTWFLIPIGAAGECAFDMKELHTKFPFGTMKDEDDDLYLLRLLAGGTVWP